MHNTKTNYACYNRSRGQQSGLQNSDLRITTSSSLHAYQMAGAYV